VGNVTRRQISFGLLSSANMAETFGYDNLHRVTSRTVTQAFALTGNLGMTESYGYDANGNISSKTGVGHYQYNVSGKPNRLVGVWQNSNFSGTQYYNFSYDSNGNVINDGKRSFTYTADDKPLLITQGTDTSRFSYGPNRELIKRIDVRSSGTTTTLLIDNLYEQVQRANGVTEHKFVIGNAIVTRRTVGGPQVYYLHKDQQGSTTAITNLDGNPIQQLLYDPWGRQYQVSSAVLTYSSQATTYGYTGHDMVNDFEVIHMGGRSYNPVLGRFMQADPFIQQASNLQSFNRYAYVLNNPMSYTDPTGYFLKKMMQLTGTTAVMKFLAKNPLLNTIAQIVVACYGGPLSVALFNFAQTYAVTGNLGRGVRAGVIAYASAWAYGKVGANTGVGDFGNVIGNGIVGGITSELQGGKFGYGFLAAGFSALMKPANIKMWGISEAMAPARIITAAVIGGTASALSGGKFANGAVTGAFSQIFNGEKQIEKMREQQNYKLYLVARGSVLTGGDRVGHAFIGGIKPDGSTEAWGYYPEKNGDLWDMLSPNSGKGEIQNDSYDFSLALAGDLGYSFESISVNRETYYEVMSRMWYAANVVDYGLVNVNCVTVATGAWNMGPASSGLYRSVTNPDVLRFRMFLNQ
jgi:RHS repeat-associated protein